MIYTKEMLTWCKHHLLSCPERSCNNQSLKVSAPFSKTMHGGCPVLAVLRGWRTLIAHGFGKTAGVDHRSPAHVFRESELRMDFERVFECSLVPVELEHHGLFLSVYVLSKPEMRLSRNTFFAHRVSTNSVQTKNALHMSMHSSTKT